MELLYVTVVAALIGAILPYVLPGRGSYGFLLLPAICAAVTATVWVGLVWLGFTFDGGWIWAISLVAGPLIAILSALLLSRYRRGADARMMHQLTGGHA